MAAATGKQVGRKRPASAPGPGLRDNGNADLQAHSLRTSSDPYRSARRLVRNSWQQRRRPQPKSAAQIGRPKPKSAAQIGRPKPKSAVKSARSEQKSDASKQLTQLPSFSAFPR